MRKIGAFQAKNTLGTLLDWVEAGEEVIVTRRGKPAARLVPVHATTTESRRLAAKAAARIHARADAAAFAPIAPTEWKAFRDEGRR